jgi:hypothetical protein
MQKKERKKKAEGKTADATSFVPARHRLTSAATEAAASSAMDAFCGGRGLWVCSCAIAASVCLLVALLQACADPMQPQTNNQKKEK